jgi:hypothetical protein
MSIASTAKAALLRNFTGSTDKKGYMHSPQENVLPGVDLTSVEDDLRSGDGDELRMKFCAVHSSCALAVNCFAPFKVNPSRLRLLGKEGASKVEFEHKLRIFDKVTGPNLDVWIEFENEVLAVESKLLEYLTPKKPEFSLRYESLAPPKSDPCWWSAYQEAKTGTVQHLDRAQLVKHYFGLNEFRQRHPECPTLTLLYLFWEPLNWQDLEECRQHREEVTRFAEAVSSSPIKFRWLTYNDLWAEWSGIPDLIAHARSLKERYEVSLSCNGHA